MKLLTLLTLFITLLLDDSLVVFGQDVKRDYVNLAKLSVEEGAQVDATIVMKTGKQLKAVESESSNDKKPQAEKTA